MNYARPVPVQDAAGFVLAGGESSRMGTDKALVEFDDEPLIARSLAILREAGLPASIAGSRSSLNAFAPVIEDKEPGLGPLSGICGAFRSCTATFCAFISVDLPLLPASLIAYLLYHSAQSDRTVTLATVSAFPQTFPVVLHRRILASLEGDLQSRKLGCLSAFRNAALKLREPLSALPVENLVQAGQISHPTRVPSNSWFHNVNAPKDLDQARAVRRAS